ncbi:MAG: ANTAR domain-containing protein [Treponema sp.]|nr:ANTAR domain-containing protein [Treponema sp.]
MDFEKIKVLLVLKDNKLSSQIKQILVPPLFEISEISDFNDARRRIHDDNYKIVITETADGDGRDFAVDISETSATILLLTNSETFDHVSYYVEPYGILTIVKPFEQFYFYNMIKVALAVSAKVERLNFQTIQLKHKMEEAKLVNRAKMLLMGHQNMTEEEAHRYIEKTAMDRCVKRIEIADEIVRSY